MVEGFSRMFAKLFSIAFVLAGLMFTAAWADVSIPPAAQPGAIQSYGIQQFNMQRTQPWLYQPIYPENLTPQEPDVHFMQTEGQVLDHNTPPCGSDSANSSSDCH